MNDIEKLHQVISTLEKQSSYVTEFNGVLGAVNSARESIDSTKTTMAKLTDEQKILVSQSYKHFEEYGRRLYELESEVKSLVETQKQALREIAALDFVTPELLEQRCATVEKVFAAQLTAIAEKIDLTSATQQSTMKSLRILVICGVLLLAGGLMFLAKGTLN